MPRSGLRQNWKKILASIESPELIKNVGAVNGANSSRARHCRQMSIYRAQIIFIDDRHWQGMREDFFCRSGLPSDTEQVPKSLAPKGRASAPEPAGAFPGRQSSFDFRAQVCHSAPMERHAFGLRFRPNALARQKGFRVTSIVNEFKEA